VLFSGVYAVYSRAGFSWREVRVSGMGTSADSIGHGGGGEGTCPYFYKWLDTGEHGE